jgi:two-component system sensor histidine kinase LytS
MFQLSITLLERLGIFVIVCIFLLRFEAFRKLLVGKATLYEKLLLSLLFGAFGIIATYMGVPIQNAIANSRAVDILLGGIIGGPMVGLSAGLIAGGHRFLINPEGFTSIPCGIGTVVAGFIGSLLYHKAKRRTFDPMTAFFVVVVVEAIQMLLIILLARPVDDAINLVKVIAVPMVVVNAAGLAVFVELVSSLSREHERIEARQAQVALNIASKTLPILREGLNHNTAAETAKIILAMTDFDAVQITDSTILAHKGAEEGHHKLGISIQTSATKAVLDSGIIKVIQTKHEIGCINYRCKLNSAVIVPLKRGENTIGTLKLHRFKENGITPVDIELGKGFAQLFSSQLELVEIENQKKLAREAEIKALQAQINPHFLFNAINTIVSYIRTNPEIASGLLIKLSEFFRRNITTPHNENVPFLTEIEHCESYLAIELARFGDRVKINCELGDDTLSCKVPPLIFQPLVENALRHGILPKEEGGEITMGAYKDNGFVKIFVRDNGIGMTGEQIDSLFSNKNERLGHHRGLGIALKNVNARLVALYGPEHSLSIESTQGKGTTVSFKIPLTES